jgi:hypothetical protein
MLARLLAMVFNAAESALRPLSGIEKLAIVVFLLDPSFV